VPHRVGERDVEVLAVDRVVERIPADVGGGLQPAGDGERTPFDGVRRREEASLDLGGEREGRVPLRPLEEVRVAP
jgi:hypothetical protein